MKFTKMHGCGNDFILLDHDQADPQKTKKFITTLADRKFGIGADGIILIGPAANAAGSIKFYNADGGPAEMCGNGLRCAAKYIHERYNTNQQFRLQTDTGQLTVTIQQTGNPAQITTDLGAPILNGLQIPTTIDTETILEQKITLDSQNLTFSAVSFGNPHCVIYVDDLEHFPVHQIGPQIETHPLFPQHTNVEFVEIISPTAVRQRTWERGSGETLACGTGAAAVTVIGRLLNKTAPQLKIHLLGGDLEVQYTGTGTVQQTGPAVEVFAGELSLKEFP